MRRSLTAAAVIVGSAAALVGAGTFSVFNDTAAGAGTLTTGTVALSLSGAKTASLPVNPTCTLPFTSAIGQRDNLGTANNTDCTASVSVSNAGSLPFTLAGSGTQVTDSLVGGVSCWTSTITDGATTGQVVLPGASQVLTLKTANTNDAAVCQGKTDTVTLSLTATEALHAPVPAVTTWGFEDGGVGWSITGTAGWAVGVPTSGPGSAHSGTKLAATVLGGNYANRVTGALVSPPMPVRAGATAASLSFSSWHQSEYAWDCGYLEVSTNSGATWSKVTPVGGYPFNGAYRYPGPGQAFYPYNMPCQGGTFSGFDTASGATEAVGPVTWKSYTVDLLPYAGQVVQMRWVLATDDATVFAGWYVDDVVLSVT